MEDGSGFEVRLQMEDAFWFANAIRERGSSGWEVGDRLVLIFHKRRSRQLDYFARELANGFDDVATVDHASLRGRNLDESDPRAAFYL